ncbi:hypothetical protein DL762_005252 [Monosporascus cannonballus]|uniref:Uncharacterized protein n=1 Tax=Monosporascus cannonballus TaxID=155416 RepID=A0ABY0H5S0_9PEZI|nr:hypothetical protein DL762_005252 [Monosporascus cannonballus]
MISEPESLVACSSRRVSEPQAQTALSSPSRRNREPALPPSRQNQQGRPYSTASAESSALSTLYSEDEAIAMAQAQAQQSPPIGELRVDDATPTSEQKSFRKETYYLPYHVFDARSTKAASGHDRSPKFAFEDEESPRPRRARREIMLGHPSQILSPQNQHSTQFTIYAYDTSDNPFTVLEVPPKNPARLSRLFSPLPVELAAGEVGPKNKREGRNGGHRRPAAPVVATPRGKLADPRYSSIYGSGAEMHADTARRSSASLVTVPTVENQLTEEDYVLGTAGLRPDNNESPDSAWSSREPRTVLLPSDSSGVQAALAAREPGVRYGSRYSQDTLPPLATPTKTNNLRVASAVTELRRMNSQVSSVSGHSATTNTDTEPGSPTLPALRGGGCSPGSRNKGGGKNYLALGGSPGASPTGKGTAGKSAVEDSPSRSGGNDRSGKGGLQRRSIAVSGRARGGTMVLSGVDAWTAAGLEQLRSGGGVLREGNGADVGADGGGAQAGVARQADRDAGLAAGAQGEGVPWPRGRREPGPVRRERVPQELTVQGRDRISASQADVNLPGGGGGLLMFLYADR